jgi:N-acetylglucosamine-6-phosphate deacetylase
MSKKIYLAKQLFTGTKFLNNHAVEVVDECITRIVPNSQLPNNAGPIYDIIAPAFIDIQIYGADNKLLSVYPEVGSLFRLYEYCSNGGAAHFIATVATNSHEVFRAAIDTIRAYWQEGGKGCLGLHIEGPWINPIKRGAHLEAFIHSPSKEEVQELLEYGKGVIKIITLAPEVCEPAIIEMIQAAGIIVSAGHSNASFEQATNAFNHYIGTATHLFNAMSPLQHRAPGFVGAVFNHPSVLCSIVPDGYHVDFEAIKIAYKQMGNRLFAITDAVAETTIGPYPHHLVGDKYESNGILSGSALTMSKALNNLVNHVGIPLEDALKMVSTIPAKAVKHASLGTISVGNQANLVCMNDALKVELLVTPD